MPRQISSSTSLDHLRKEAKRWLRALRRGEAGAHERLDRAYPAASSHPVLRDMQHALAREYSFENWAELKRVVAEGAARENETAPAALGARTAEELDRIAEDFTLAFNVKDEAALRRLNAQYGRSFTFEDLWAEIWRRVYSFRQRAFREPNQMLRLEEAQVVVAQDAGFQSWSALQQAVRSGARPIAPYEIDEKDNSISPRRRLTESEWDELIAVMKERRITTLSAHGLMTDSVIARVTALDHVTALDLGGSRELSDDGLLQLARMPQLETLNLSEYPGGKLTDRGLEALRDLHNLRRFEMTWQRGITDAGAANLRWCDRLEQVKLMGSPTGDGAIEALQGKPQLTHFSSGRLVTDAGLPFLHNFPKFKEWHGGDVAPDAKDIPGAAHLLIDGPFTNHGLAALAGLAGVADLDLFWHVTGITSEGFAHLVGLPNLLSLGADGGLSDDDAMRYFALMPRLRWLRAQEAVATDDGFEALSASRTLEGLWGRDCANLGDRGFLALSRMPSLRRLGVSCKNVADDALAALPRFPALRELTPIGVKDPGFKYVGQCEGLERLTCMYCRETTDLATEFIPGLQIRYYYAGLTKISDRSLEILGTMRTLEQIELYECNGVTDAGLQFLALLPNLREVHLDTLPGVTFEGTRVFPPHVRVKYST